MSRSSVVTLLLAGVLAGGRIFAQESTATAHDDALLRAMRDEIRRSLDLKLPNLDAPYFIEYSVDSGRSVSATATLGALVNSNDGAFRQGQVQVRAGSYAFDDTNYVGSFSVARESLALGDDTALLRRQLWLATDHSYKAAVESLSRKKAAVRSLNLPDSLPDFAPPTAKKGDATLRVMQSLSPISFEPLRAQTMARNISRVFRAYPAVKDSSVSVSWMDNAHYLVNTEGAELRVDQRLASVRISGTAQAADGMQVNDAAFFDELDVTRLDPEQELQVEASKVGANLSALVAAPIGEAYSGPVLFDSVAAAQLFGELLVENLRLARKPVGEPGRPFSFTNSDLDGRKGVRILPEHFQVVDEPARSEWRGKRLIGQYEVDDEGVKPGRLVLVEKGVLKNFLLTRQPIRGMLNADGKPGPGPGYSNGRARINGAFGAGVASISNLFVSSDDSVPAAELKGKLMEICRQREKPYGILVRKMDFPSSVSLEQARRLLADGNAGSNPVSLPVMLYRVYPDGREELVRGMRFRAVNVRSLKDIIATGDDSNVFSYLDNGAIWSLTGASSSVAPVSVIAPSVLIDDLELVKIEEEFPKLPIVPPPFGMPPAGVQTANVPAPPGPAAASEMAPSGIMGAVLNGAEAGSQ